MSDSTSSSSSSDNTQKAVITVGVLGGFILIALIVAKIVDYCYDRHIAVSDDASDISEHTRDLIRSRLAMAAFMKKKDKAKPTEISAKQKKIIRVWSAKAKESRRLAAEQRAKNAARRNELVINVEEAAAGAGRGGAKRQSTNGPSATLTIFSEQKDRPTSRAGKGLKVQVKEKGGSRSGSATGPGPDSASVSDKTKASTDTKPAELKKTLSGLDVSNNLSQSSALVGVSSSGNSSVVPPSGRASPAPHAHVHFLDKDKRPAEDDPKLEVLTDRTDRSKSPKPKNVEQKSPDHKPPPPPESREPNTQPSKPLTPKASPPKTSESKSPPPKSPTRKPPPPKTPESKSPPPKAPTPKPPPKTSESKSPPPKTPATKTSPPSKTPTPKSSPSKQTESKSPERKSPRTSSPGPKSAVSTPRSAKPTTTAEHNPEASPTKQAGGGNKKGGKSQNPDTEECTYRLLVEPETVEVGENKSDDVPGSPRKPRPMSSLSQHQPITMVRPSDNPPPGPPPPPPTTASSTKNNIQPNANTVPSSKPPSSPVKEPPPRKPRPKSLSAKDDHHKVKVVHSKLKKSSELYNRASSDLQIHKEMVSKKKAAVTIAVSPVRGASNANSNSNTSPRTADKTGSGVYGASAAAKKARSKSAKS